MNNHSRVNTINIGGDDVDAIDYALRRGLLVGARTTKDVVVRNPSKRPHPPRLCANLRHLSTRSRLYWDLTMIAVAVAGFICDIFLDEVDAVLLRVARIPAAVTRNSAGLYPDPPPACVLPASMILCRVCVLCLTCCSCEGKEGSLLVVVIILIIVVLAVCAYGYRKYKSQCTVNVRDSSQGP